jgi:hypothetical protein
MSGEIGNSVKTSGKAVDGIMARKWGAGSCIRTPGKATTEWWAVDLLDLYKIRNVVVVNRGEEGKLYSLPCICIPIVWNRLHKHYFQCPNQSTEILRARESTARGV